MTQKLKYLVIFTSGLAISIDINYVICVVYPKSGKEKLFQFENLEINFCKNISVEDLFITTRHQSRFSHESTRGQCSKLVAQGIKVQITVIEKYFSSLVLSCDLMIAVYTAQPPPPYYSHPTHHQHIRIITMHQIHVMYSPASPFMLKPQSHPAKPKHIFNITAAAKCFSIESFHPVNFLYSRSF